MEIWIVGLEKDGKWWCANRSPLRPPLSTADSYSNSMQSALNEAQSLMMKHPIKRDMSKARIVSNPSIGFGIPRLEAPEYIDMSDERQTPAQVSVVEAPTRYQALKVAKQEYNSRTLNTGVHNVN